MEDVLQAEYSDELVNLTVSIWKIKLVLDVREGPANFRNTYTVLFKCRSLKALLNPEQNCVLEALRENANGGTEN